MKKIKSIKLHKLFKPKFIITIFITLVIGFFAGLGYSNYFSKNNQKQTKYPSKAIVTSVTDGDTIELDTDQKFRLYGISCPDYGKPFYNEAKDFVKDLVLNKEVIIEYEEKYKDDKFGRLLGYIILPNSPNNLNLPNILNVSLVRQGLCKIVIYKKRAKLIYHDELLEAESQAKEDNINIWGH